MSRVLMRLKSYLWHLDRMVGGSFCGSVVARMKMACSGGYYKVFSSALKLAAEVDSECTSSMMMTR